MQKPEWIDSIEYPFQPNSIELEMGKMHYVDEGEGEIILFIHGTPTWSFLYRKMIKDLSSQYRCIAIDHIGFGLSDKPKGWSYKPSDHANNLKTFIERLGLNNFNLVVHDFGGPIGLSYALDHPHNIKRLVLFNTWMWSNIDNRNAMRISKFLSTGVGKFLYKKMNLSAKAILKQAWVNKSTLTKNIHGHYTSVFQTPDDRHSTWVLARELSRSNDWYGSLWNKRNAIAEISVLLIWGMKDPAFKPIALERWEELFTNKQVIKLENVGHFAQEEAPRETIDGLTHFLKD